MAARARMVLNTVGFAAPLCILVALAIFALFTNRWPGWNEGLEILFLADVKDGYLRIADAAPAFPAERMPKHIAQRFFFPWLVGIIGKCTGLSLPVLFSVLTALTHIGILLAFFRVLLLCGVGVNKAVCALALLFLQPYAFRYYWIGPGMVNDSLFVFGAALALEGLFFRRHLLILTGVAVAALSRQTAVMLFPGIVFYLAFGTPWRNGHRGEYVWKRAGVWIAGASLSLVVGILFITGKLVEGFSKPSVTAETVYGVFPWLLSPQFTLPAFAEHILRCVLPLFCGLLLLVMENPRKWSLEAWACFLMSAAIAAQPFLAGPALTGQNAGRLATIGLLPLSVAWATARREDLRSSTAYWLMTLFAIGSFHHVYTKLGPSSSLGSAILQLLVAVAVILVTLKGQLRRSQKA